MADLTRRQEAILEYLIECVQDGSYIPTVREIADHFGFSSTNGVRDHLKALERKGVIRRRPNEARGIEIDPAYLREERGVPIVGRVAAGTPITAVENLEGYLELDGLYERGRHYALRVRGDSMVDDGIWDGDFAIVREQPAVENGEIGVAIVEGEATVKRIRLDGATAELVPANELYRPLRVDLRETEFRIGGKVVGVHRVLN